MFIFKLKPILKIFVNLCLFLISLFYNWKFSGLIFADEEDSVLELDGWTKNNLEANSSDNLKIIFLILIPLIISASLGFYWIYTDLCVVLTVDDAKNLLDFFVKVNNLESNTGDLISTSEVASKNFNWILRLIVKCIKVLINWKCVEGNSMSNMSKEGDPEYDSLVLEMFEKSFPKWTKNLESLNLHLQN